MTNDKTVKDAYLEAVLNQMATGDPPETNTTYERLKAAGHSNNEALQLISACLRAEMGRMLSESKPFDNDRFSEMLKKLPLID
ncbi:MAG TPA: hypothetical protein VN878_04685 [Usitatibacter sp.]|nr:hypothetical protein [Usitatibacter sp.]